MRKAMKTLLRLAGSVVAASCLLSLGWADETHLPRSADQLTLPTLRSHMSVERLDVLVNRWIGLVNAADVTGAIAAIELLDGAPSAFVRVAVSRLRQSEALEKVFAAATDAQKSELRNSGAINRTGLRDLLWRDYLQSFQTALSANSETAVLALIPNADFMPSLPAPVAKAFLDGLENGQLGDQARHEISMVLIKKWNSLAEQAQRLRGWLSEQGAEGGARVTRKRVARSVLARLRQALPSADFNALLEEGDPDARIAALDQLKSIEPQRWARLYDDVQQTRALATWDLATLKRFIDAAGPDQTTALDRWSASIKLPSNGSEALQCPDLLWRLSLLSRQSAPRAVRFATLWNLLSKRSACRDDISADVDKTLIDVAGNDLGAWITRSVDRDGPTQLAAAPLRLPSVSRYVSELLETRLSTGDTVGAQRLLDIGAVPSAAGLEKRGYWTSVFKPHPDRAVTVTDLRVLQIVEGPPPAAYATAAHFAEDQSASIPLRGAALLALAGRPEPGIHAFIVALSDQSAAVSRPALILLARAYDAAADPRGLPLPDAELMSLVRTRPDLSADSSTLLRAMVRYGPSFAAAYADAVGEDQWRAKPSQPCFALAELPTLGSSVLGPAFDALPGSKAYERDAILSCILILSDPKSATARVGKAWRQATPSESSELLQGIRTLWEDETFRGVTSKEVAIRDAGRHLGMRRQ
jgi:hypothetical protein